MKTEDILNEREKTHGDFGQYSELRTLIADALVEFMCKHKIKRAKLNDVQLTAINSIISKMCRIFCGDPNFADHWDDIAGYAMLGRGGQVKKGCDCYTVPGTEEFVMCDEHKMLQCDELRKMKETENSTSSKMEHVQEEPTEWHSLQRCVCIDCSDPYLGIPGLKGRCIDCIKEEPTEEVPRDIYRLQAKCCRCSGGDIMRYTKTTQSKDDEDIMVMHYHCNMCGNYIQVLENTAFDELTSQEQCNHPNTESGHKAGREEKKELDCINKHHVLNVVALADSLHKDHRTQYKICLQCRRVL